MERLRRVGTVLRNNWKKSVFLAGVAGYGANWYARKLEVCTLRFYIYRSGAASRIVSVRPEREASEEYNVAN
jgi:hypothetical protein